MNAHINRDLVLAIVQTYQSDGGSPSHGDLRYADFTRVNDLLAAVEAHVKKDFLSGPLSDVDRVTSPLDDVLAMWDVRAAREAAWRNAEVLWHLQHTPLLAAVGQHYFDALDGTVGLASRGLLVHIR